MTQRNPRGGRDRGAHRGAAHDRWLVSYADLMTLLFAFFTVMYAVSTVDVDKLAPAASSMQAAFAAPASRTGARTAVAARQAGSVPAGDATGNPVAKPEPAEPPVAGESLHDVRRRVAAELGDAVAGGRLEVSVDARGLVLSLPVEATFAIGSADVQPDALVLIGRIAASVGPMGNAIRIEGHTDNVPIRTARYGSNWELSTARASAVVAYLISEARLAPARLSAAGYGEFHPRVSNDSAEGRARNRRVDIVVLTGKSLIFEP